MDTVVKGLRCVNTYELSVRAGRPVCISSVVMTCRQSLCVAFFAVLPVRARLLPVCLLLKA